MLVSNKNRKLNLQQKKFKTNFTKPIKIVLETQKSTTSAVINSTDKTTTIISSNISLSANCDNQLCKNGGTCIAKINEKSLYECFCSKGYAGYHCELSKFML